MLLAIEIIAIDFLKRPDIMAFDRYAFCDTGANLTLQRLVSDGLRPTVDFGYHYGLLPILIGKCWFAIAGLTPNAYQALMVVCDLLVAAAIAKIATALRFGAISLALTVITLELAMQASYPSAAQGLEAALLSWALAEQSAGDKRGALVFATAAAFTKPSMGYVYSVLLIAFACRSLRGEKVVRRLLHVIAPAAVASIVIASVLAASYGPYALVHTVLPLEGAVAYRALHYGFFNGAGRDFWDPRDLPWFVYLVDASGFWIAGTIFLICSGGLALLSLATDKNEPEFEVRRNEIIVTCAILHVAFISLFFGNRSSWIYYAYLLTIGVAASAGVGAIQRRVTFFLCLLGIMAWTDIVFPELQSWHTRQRDAVTAGLWAPSDEREEWQEVLDAVHSQRASILDTKGAVELLVPGFEEPLNLYLDPALMVPADIQRKVEQISNAQMVVVPVGGIEVCSGIPAAPEFDTALKSFDLRMRGKFFDVYQRPNPPVSPASR